MGDPVSDTIAHAVVRPEGPLATLSEAELTGLHRICAPEHRSLLRRCALAVLTSGVETDDPRTLLERHAAFELSLHQVDRGIRLHLERAPARAFVEGTLIEGIREQLFAVLRDLAWLVGALPAGPAGLTEAPTEAIFRHLRQAGVFPVQDSRPLAVCWGGHSIGREEYDYCKEVGYRLGLRGMDICTGCGPGAMKGPMKGAAIAHVKQRIPDGRYVGITEPGIIASEAPNPIVNTLVILPDIEKRLEAFVRLAHVILVFPGGVGTIEELVYAIGVRLHNRNRELDLPIIITGPESSADYLAAVDDFIGRTLGQDARRCYTLIVGDHEAVAREAHASVARTLAARDRCNDAAYFNWSLHLEPAWQAPFQATHASMRGLALNHHLPPAERAFALRKLFTGLVSGNVREEGIAAIEAQGPFTLTPAPEMQRALASLLDLLEHQGRMRFANRTRPPLHRFETGSPEAHA